MTRHDPDRAAWLDRHPVAVDIAVNWCGLTLLLAGILTLLFHVLARQQGAPGPDFAPVLAVVATTRLAGWAAKRAWRQTIGRRTQP